MVSAECQSDRCGFARHPFTASACASAKQARPAIPLYFDLPSALYTCSFTILNPCPPRSSVAGRGDAMSLLKNRGVLSRPPRRLARVCPSSSDQSLFFEGERLLLLGSTDLTGMKSDSCRLMRSAAREWQSRRPYPSKLQPIFPTVVRSEALRLRRTASHRARGPEPRSQSTGCSIAPGLHRSGSRRRSRPTRRCLPQFSRQNDNVHGSRGKLRSARKLTFPAG